jgi:glutathione-regulated potassium-efflux system ancillary protein KefC
VLNAQGFRTVVLDIDSSQVDTLRKFGFKVFYGDALRLDLLEAAGAKEARLLVIAMDDHEKVSELARIARDNYPSLKLLIRAFDRSHAHDLLREGFNDIYREVFGSSLDMTKDALTALGRTKAEAERIITTFRELDEKFLRRSAPVSEDQNQLIDLARQSRAEIARVFAADRGEGEPGNKAAE